MSADKSSSTEEDKKPTVEELETTLAARRTALATDLERLGARMAPPALKAQAAEASQQVASQARDRIQALRQDVTTRVRSLVSSDDGAAGGQAAGAAAAAYGIVPEHPATAADLGGLRTEVGTVFEPSTARHLQARVSRLLDDARDGDPTSLAIITGAALALAGISVAAVVAAVRR